MSLHCGICASSFVPLFDFIWMRLMTCHTKLNEEPNLAKMLMYMIVFQIQVSYALFK